MIAMKTRLIAVLFLPCAGVVAAPVAPGNMKAYCRGEASAQFATKPQYINRQAHQEQGWELFHQGPC